MRIGRMGLIEWLWQLLPDKCEVQNMNTYWECPRTGVRGNENRIVWPDGKTRVMCDDCSVMFRKKFGRF